MNAIKIPVSKQNNVLYIVAQKVRDAFNKFPDFFCTGI